MHPPRGESIFVTSRQLQAQRDADKHMTSMKIYNTQNDHPTMWWVPKSTYASFTESYQSLSLLPYFRCRVDRQPLWKHNTSPEHTIPAIDIDILQSSRSRMWSLQNSVASFASPIHEALAQATLSRRPLYPPSSGRVSTHKSLNHAIHW
jgi:hypothetical protein